MACSGFAKCRAAAFLQLVLGCVVIIVSLTNLVGFYYAGFFLHDEDICRHFYGVEEDAYGTRALSDQVGKVLQKMETLQINVESELRDLQKDIKDELGKGQITKAKLKSYLEEEIIQPLYSARLSLRQIDHLLYKTDATSKVIEEEPLINYYVAEELRKYITPKENRHKRSNVYMTGVIYNTIGHACVLMKKELEEYMDYKVGSHCKDDWNLAQELMLQGCDPLPRRRCLARDQLLHPRPNNAINESLWKIPVEDRKCSNFHNCLSISKNSQRRGFSTTDHERVDQMEKLRWVANNSGSSPSVLLPVDFIISDVLGTIKPGGEIRIGLDYSIGTSGTFAARMRKHNVTIISTALNLGAPFNEMIALRGLLPLHLTPNHRLPFFDNTLDLIHTTGFLDGWIDLLPLDFIMFDWDRILRPGGLLWIDRFYCDRRGVQDYMYVFLQFRYKKHKWVTAPKSGDQVYLSAILEKPLRSV